MTRTCDGCRFCCWSWHVAETDKRGLSHCPHECALGCDLHGTPQQPDECQRFRCPYLRGAKIHRPDAFQPTLEALGGNLACYIPTVPESIPTAEAIEVIERTRSIPAGILIEGLWMRGVIPLNKNADGTWKVVGDIAAPWNQLTALYE